MFESAFSCAEPSNRTTWRSAVATCAHWESAIRAGLPGGAAASAEDPERAVRRGFQNLVQGALAVSCQVQRDVLESEIPERV